MPLLSITFMILMPPFTSHDETHHWVRAYEISEGHFITPIKGNKIGSQIPSSVIKNINKKYNQITYLDVQNFTDVKLNKNKKTTTDMSTVAIYSPVQYIPQAIGIFLARLITDKLFILVYAARLANIVFCLFILYRAIKIMPIGKKIMLLPLMLPITIEGIASMSADGFTNSIAFLFIAYIFKEIYSKDKIKTTYSEDMNTIIKRVFNPDYDIRKHLPKTKGIEVMTNTAPMQRYVGTENFGIITKGLTEYEVYKNTLSVTLLRSTGVISNSKNPSRSTPAGPPLPVNEAQQMGHNSAEFALGFFKPENYKNYVEEFYSDLINL